MRGLARLRYGTPRSGGLRSCPAVGPGDGVLKWLATFVVCGCLAAGNAQAAPPTSHRLTAAATRLRAATYQAHPCLAQIIDREDGAWDPTVDFGGGHGNTAESYGLVQANPGTKMVSAGPLWRTDAATQIRWGLSYARARYGSECAAWAYWQGHGSW